MMAPSSLLAILLLLLAMLAPSVGEQGALGPLGEDEGIFGAPIRAAAAAAASPVAVAPVDKAKAIENTRTLLAGDSGDTDEAAAKESKKDMNERIRAVFSSKPKDDSTSAVVEKESTVTATATGIANSRLPQPAAELHGNTRHVMDVTDTPPPPAGTDTQTVDKHTSEMGAFRNQRPRSRRLR